MFLKIWTFILLLKNYIFSYYFINPNYYDYNLFFFSFFFILLIGLILVFISFFFIKTFSDKEKLSVYECGFEPFETARINVDIHFFTVGLVFLIFDLEIFFIIPFVYNFLNINLIGFLVFLIFLLLLLIGLIYEFKKGVLNWTKKT